MALVCALTGVAPEAPVVSPSGYIFERRAVEKHLKENGGACPITGEVMTAADLKNINVSKIAKPRTVNANSIPGLLGIFQSEWDTTMSEMFALRQHVEQVRSQLSQTLYQHEASCRVIARLIKERNSAQGRVSQLQDSITQLEAKQAAGISGVGGSEMEPGLSDLDYDQVVELSLELPKERRRRNKTAPFDASLFQQFGCQASYPLHQTTNPGILCCSLVERSEDAGGRSLIATGGVDGAVVVFDYKEKATKARLLGHMKRVNKVHLSTSSVSATTNISTDSILISASEDKTCRIWRCVDDESQEYVCAHVVRRHLGAVTDMDMHPISTFIATSGKDKTWALHDIASGRTLHSVNDLPHNYRCVRFHPDGALLSAGDSTGKFEIWDMKSKKPSAKIVSLGEHDGPLTSIAFSEGGIHAATASTDGTVRMWDLRKPIVFQKLTPTGEENPLPVEAVAFDKSANFIAAAAGNDIHLYSMPHKSLATAAAQLSGHTSTVTDVCFSKTSDSLFSTSMDRMVKLWEQTATGDGD